MQAKAPTRTAIWLTVVLVCGALSTVGRFSNGFAHDDLAMLRAGLIDDPSRLGEVFQHHAMLAQGSSELLPMDTYRPVSIVSFFWDAWLSGKEPWSYHLTNLLLHLACVASLFVLMRRTLPNAALWLVASASLFFGLSPQLVEAHVWINGRSDPLCTLGGIAALLLLERAQAASGLRSSAMTLASGLSFLAGLLSKETLLFALPALIMWPWPARLSLSIRVRRAWPLLFATAVYLGMRTWALGGLRSSRDQSQLREALQNLPLLWLDGLRELVFPTRLYLRSLHEEYAALSPAYDVAALLLVLVLALALFFARKRLPVLCAGMVWYALSLAPAALISAVVWPGFGRYLYLPCAGLALGLCEILTLADRKISGSGPQASARRTAMMLACAGYLLFFGVQSARYTRDYADAKALYAAVIEHAPARASGYAQMASLLVSEGKVREALPLYLRAIEREPREPSHSLQAIFWSFKVGELAAAEKLARHAIENAQDPLKRDAFLALLLRVLAERDPDLAVAELCSCLTQDPSREPCLQAPRWMLDPRGARFTALRAALLRFADTCPSQAAQRAFAGSLQGPSAP